MHGRSAHLEVLLVLLITLDPVSAIKILAE